MSIRIDQRKEQKLKQEQAEIERTKRLSNLFNDVCITAEGILVLRHIMQICGFQKTSIVGDPTTGDLQSRGTFYNEARRNVYLELRKFIKPKFLKKIEFPTQS